MTDPKNLVDLCRIKADQWSKMDWVQGDLVGADAHAMIDEIERLRAALTGINAIASREGGRTIDDIQRDFSDIAYTAREALK